MGHLADQGFGQPQVPATLVGRFLAGQRDLRGHPAALPFGRDAGGGVRGPHRGIEVDGDPGLGGRGGGFQLFEGAELVDPFGVGDIPLEGGELVDPAGDNDGIYCRTQFVVAGRTSLSISPLKAREFGWVGAVCVTFSSLVEEMFDAQVCSGDRGVHHCERGLGSNASGWVVAG